MKETAVTFRAAKGQRKLSMLTAYDYTTARLMEQSGVDALLVGDSLAMMKLAPLPMEQKLPMMSLSTSSRSAAR